MHVEKRICDLEDDVKESEAVNKRLKEELQNYKKKVRRSSKGDIRDSNGRTDDEALLAKKVTKFSRDYGPEGRHNYLPQQQCASRRILLVRYELIASRSLY